MRRIEALTFTVAISVLMTRALAAPDLAIEKTVSNPTPMTNESVEFTVKATNIGDETAVDVHVQDLLPPELAIPAGMAAAPSTGSYDDATGDWQVGDLNATFSAILTIPAIATTANPPDCIVNAASTSHANDLNPANDYGRAAIRQTGVERCVDLDLDFGLRAGPLIVFPTCDLQGRYAGHVDITNFGPDAASNIVVSIAQSPVVGPNLRFDDAACSNAPASRCDITMIASGEVVTINVTSDLYQSYQTFEQTIFLSVTTTDTDYDLSNNDAAGTGIGGGFSSCDELDIDVPNPFVGGPCFIATAAYGSPLDPRIDVLRRFRDSRLLTNQWGRAFVDSYYRLSPPIADFIAPRPWARAIVRAFLAPLVLGVAYPQATLVCLFALTVIIAGWRKRKSHRGL